MPLIPPTRPKPEKGDEPITLSKARRDLAMIAGLLMANTKSHASPDFADFYDDESAVHDAWHIMKAAKSYDPDNATYLQVKL